MERCGGAISLFAQEFLVLIDAKRQNGHRSAGLLLFKNDSGSGHDLRWLVLAGQTRVLGLGAIVRIASREEVVHLPRWSRAFAGERKDHRFYELIEDSLKDGFRYGYFVDRHAFV